VRGIVEIPCGGFGRICSFVPDDRFIASVTENGVLQSVALLASFEQSPPPWLKVVSQMSLITKTAHPRLPNVILSAVLVSFTFAKKWLYIVELAGIDDEEKKGTSHEIKR